MSRRTLERPVALDLPEEVVRALRFSSRPTLRVPEAAEWLGVSPETVEAHLAECIVRLGRVRLVVTAGVREVLAEKLRENRQSPATPLERARTIVGSS